MSWKICVSALASTCRKYVNERGLYVMALERLLLPAATSTLRFLKFSRSIRHAVLIDRTQRVVRTTAPGVSRWRWNYVFYGRSAQCVHTCDDLCKHIVSYYCMHLFDVDIKKQYRRGYTSVGMLAIVTFRTKIPTGKTALAIYIRWCTYYTSVAQPAAHVRPWESFLFFWPPKKTSV